ncbi:MAG: DUF4012 domain-containing protein [Actinomycetia bacterium]|nr:DUF4012 domain-containing protein [Actinomycetes bacterium]
MTSSQVGGWQGFSRRNVVNFLILVLLLWCVFAGYRLTRAVSAASDARGALDSVDLDYRAWMAGDDQFDADIASVRSSLEKVHSSLSGPLMAPVRIVPFVGRQVRSADALSESGSQMIGVVDDLLVVIDEAGPGLQAADKRVATLRLLAAQMAEAHATLGSLDLGPEENLLSQLREVRTDLSDAIEEGLHTMEVGSEVAGEVAALLDGPSRYVLGAANNAEMRAGSGLVLSAGEIVAGSGGVLVTEMTPSWTRNLGSPVAIPDADLRSRWGWLTDGQNWLLNWMSPRFPATAEHAVAMWNAQSDQLAEGIVVVDPFALRTILRLTGPVETSIGTVDAQNVIELFLNGQYQGSLPGTGDQVLRRDSLADVAPNVVQKLFTADIDVARLFDQLRDVVDGRHLLIWSADTDRQQVWERVGVSGALDDRTIAVSLINRGPNKLDYFTNLRTEIAAVREGDRFATVTLTTTITNRTPVGQPQYVEGPVQGSITPAGAYRGIVTFNVPGAAINVSIDDVDDLSVAGPDGPTRVVGTEVLIERGSSAVVIVRFDLPNRVTELTLEPSARFPIETWVIGGESRRDGLSETVLVSEL